MKPPPFDPELGTFLESIAHLIGPPPTREELPAVRRPSPLQPRPTDEELSRDGRFRITEDGPLVICLPADAPGPVPALYWMHGGGMVMGDNRSGGLVQMLDLVADLPAAVIAVNYGLAPEHPHPQPVEDGHGVWDRRANAFGWGCLLGDAAGGPDVSPYAAPARATDLSGLPPAYVDVGSAETFRDEDVAYANAIWQAGGVAELHVWPGAFHGFDGFVPDSRLARQAWATRREWLTRVL
ncbi:alpha/beta hydrolase [Cryptosporangium sp. NPDC051539]|uniref:alpha/beta hydrolase n=1 Tax=Cryptosporangium sp. NPDC051539 TaxID=3363962 RepID=UPI00379F0E9E